MPVDNPKLKRPKLFSTELPSISKRVHSRRRMLMKKRLVLKSGECNIALANVSKRHLRFLTDLFTTLVEIKWRYTLLLFVLAFVLSWLVFSLIWWVIGYVNGDLDNYENPDHKPCVDNVYDFTTALLFSIETQHTIG